MITRLRKNEIFVFGSNEAGIHGVGGALYAYLNFGAQWGIGHGLTGRSYALPTRGRTLLTLSLARINDYVEIFLDYAAQHPELIFQVTPIGCGHAGLSRHDIAPMFSNNTENVILPIEFLDSLGRIKSQKCKLRSAHP